MLTYTVADVIKELLRIGDEISANEIEQMCDMILTSDRIFTVGRGRSGLVSKMFAMRLMHLNLEAFAIDEVVTPSIKSGDLMIICSGSGKTASLVTMAEKAVSLGASLQIITASAGSTIAKMANGTVLIPGYTPKNSVNKHLSIQPMGSQFEQLLLIVLDTAVVYLMEKKGVTENEMMARHANIE